MKPNRSAWITPVLLLAAAGWKLIFLLLDAVPFNSDEAIVALMARHILQGDRPIFFYGQAYMGSLDAWLVAAGFALFGQGVWVIRMVQALLYLGTIWTTIRMGEQGLGSRLAGWIAGVLLALPAVNTTLYTTASLGGYGEALLLGNLVLLTSFSIQRKLGNPSPQGLGWRFLAWGFWAGLGLWANGLTLVYTAPAGLLLLWLLFRRGSPLTFGRAAAALGQIVAGFLAGASPWLIYAAQQGPLHLLAELGGGAVAVEQASWLERTGSHLVNYFLLGLTALLGFRPPWEVRWLAFPLIAPVLAFWLAVAGFMLKRPKAGHTTPMNLVLAGVLAVVSAGFLFTPFGVDPSGRYFLPMIVPLALFAAQMMVSLGRRRSWQVVLLGVVLIFNAWGTFQSALRNPPGLTTQFYKPTQLDHRYDAQLMAFLRQKGETRGYTNYWVSYPLAFLSQEDLIFIPVLPYHPDLSYTARDNRYAPYTAEVLQAGRTAYIQAGIPEVSAQIRAGLRDLDVTWQETRIGDYEVFYQLSRPVRPAEIGFSDP